MMKNCPVQDVNSAKMRNPDGIVFPLRNQRFRELKLLAQSYTDPKSSLNDTKANGTFHHTHNYWRLFLMKYVLFS